MPRKSSLGLFQESWLAEKTTIYLVLEMSDYEEDVSPEEQLGAAVFDDNLEAARALIAAGANPDGEYYYEPIAKCARSTPMATLLYQHGAKFGGLKMSDDGRRALAGLSINDDADDRDKPLKDVSQEDFEAGRLRRFGRSNPERMEVPFWDAMVRKGYEAYTARKKFDFKCFNESIWCADRMGHPLAVVEPASDGDERLVVQVGGEHEDFYDPDFVIYNDVIVHHPDQGGRFEIYGYPEDVFPPTDFHTVTLVGREWIYIIGNTGYGKSREFGITPVYRLSVKDWSIHKVETSGEFPGAISRHKAELKDNEIWVTEGWAWVQKGDGGDFVDNHNTWILDLETMVWRKK